MTALAASQHPSPDANTGEDAKEPLPEYAQRAMFGLRFHIDFLEQFGTDFQRWFGKLAGHTYPGDFAQIRPYGKRGDRKCDGWRPSSRTAFQCYVPQTDQARRFITAISEAQSVSKPIGRATE